MFLNKLDTKSKEVFLQLAHHVARSDESFTDMQKSLIGGYLKEMNIFKNLKIFTSTIPY